MDWLAAILATVIGVGAPGADHTDPPCASIGRPTRGALQGGIQLVDGEHWKVVAPEHAWATPEALHVLVAAIESVEAQYPDGHPLHIGDLSRERGGRLFPHRSHQSGRDADVGYYYQPHVSGHWYRHATSKTLDRERTWALIEALIASGEVEYIFIDRTIQRLLREHARDQGVPKERLDQIFQLGSRHPSPIVRHTWGHATHMHVRFASATCPSGA